MSHVRSRILLSPTGLLRLDLGIGASADLALCTLLGIRGRGGGDGSRVTGSLSWIVSISGSGESSVRDGEGSNGLEVVGKSSNRGDLTSRERDVSEELRHDRVVISAVSEGLD
jgi:hypothetical protein